jgi:hypothetical protein
VGFWLFIGCLSLFVGRKAYCDVRFYKEQEAARVEADREVPGDYLAEVIEQRWLEACAVDPVQQALLAMDVRDRELAEERAARVMQPPPRLQRCCGSTTLPHWHTTAGVLVLGDRMLQQVGDLTNEQLALYAGAGYINKYGGLR